MRKGSILSDCCGDAAPRLGLSASTRLETTRGRGALIWLARRSLADIIPCRAGQYHVAQTAVPDAGRPRFIKERSLKPNEAQLELHLNKPCLWAAWDVAASPPEANTCQARNLRNRESFPPRELPSSSSCPQFSPAFSLHRSGPILSFLDPSFGPLTIRVLNFCRTA